MLVCGDSGIATFALASAGVIVTGPIQPSRRMPEGVTHCHGTAITCGLALPDWLAKNHGPWFVQLDTINERRPTWLRVGPRQYCRAGIEARNDVVRFIVVVPAIATPAEFNTG